MALVEHDPQYRRTWMFPRNIRRIEPWKLDQIVNLLLACQSDIGDQQVQDSLYAELDALGVKRERNKGGVDNAGGMRTYFAQLAMLGLVWQDENKLFQATRAGEAIQNHQNPLKVLRTQLLRIQFPSSYSNGAQVKIHPDIKVKPFAFLLRLMMDSRLKYLTVSEMAIPVMFGHNDSCFEFCVEKIQQMRDSGSELADVVNDLHATYTTRSKERSLEEGLHDVEANIANTAKNYLQAAQLIEPADFPVTSAWQVTSDQETRDYINQLIDEPIISLSNLNAIAFQKRFGRYDKEKDTKQASPTTKKDGFSILIQSRFTAEITSAPFATDVESFIRKTSQEYGKKQEHIRTIIAPLTEQRKTIERDAFMQYALSGGEKSLEMELGATALFKKIGFDLSEHYGQKKAKRNRKGGFPDIYIKTSTAKVRGWGDTKATARYTFPLTDQQKLGTYYKDCWQEVDKNTPTTFFVYIAGGFRISNVASHLSECHSNFGAPVSALTAKALLDLAEMTPPPPISVLINAFSKDEYYASAEQIVNSGKKRQGELTF